MQANLFLNKKCPYCGQKKVVLAGDKDGFYFVRMVCFRVSPRKPTREEAEKAAFGQV